MMQREEVEGKRGKNNSENRASTGSDNREIGSRGSLIRMRLLWALSGFVADCICSVIFFFSSRRRHTRCYRDWSSDVCSSDLLAVAQVFRPDLVETKERGV